MKTFADALAQAVDAEMRWRARLDEQVALDGAIRLAAEDGEHGVSSPRRLSLSRMKHPLAGWSRSWAVLS